MSQQLIIERLKSFWIEYSIRADFLAMAKLIRGGLELCDSKEFLDQIEKQTDELEALTPIMEFKEFFTCTKTIQYARRTIATRRGTTYAAGLSRQLTELELEQLIRSQGAQGDRAGTQGTESGSESFIDIVGDLRDDGNDGDEA